MPFSVSLTSGWSVFKALAWGRSDNANLLSLPDELLSMILEELEIADVLNVREVCQTLHRVSVGRSLWRSIFRAHLPTSIPNPFFLPHPLDLCTPRDIQLSLRRWQADWAPTQVGQHMVRPISKDALEGRVIDIITSTMLPGGRWIVASFKDASVWCFDLSNTSSSTGPVTSHLLIPSPYSETDMELGDPVVSIAFDYTSDEALGGSKFTHFLQQFNVAVVTCHPRVDQQRTSIDIWRVEIVPTSGDSALGDLHMTLGDRLSSFTELPVKRIGGSSLYGGSVAYTLYSRAGPFIAVVDWAEAQGQSAQSATGLTRRFIRLQTYTVHLLPGKRLLTTHIPSFVRLFGNWETFTKTTEPSPTLTAGLHCQWSQEGNGSILPYGITPALVLGGRAYVVIPTDTELLSVSYLVDDNDERALRVESLIKGKFVGREQKLALQICGHNRAIGMSGPRSMFSSQYHRKTITRSGDGEERPNMFRMSEYSPHPHIKLKRARVCFDQFTNTVVLIDDRYSKLVVVKTYTSNPTKLH